MSSITMAADSTQSGWDKTHRRTKKKSKKSKKTKKHGKARDENDSENDSDLDLEKELKPIGAYMRDRESMVDHMFRSISCKKLQAMLPEILKPIPSDDLRHMCKETLEVMSRKRITRILAGDDPETISSSGTDDDFSDDPTKTQDSDDCAPLVAVDSTSHPRSATGNVSQDHSADPGSPISSLSSDEDESSGSSRSPSPSESKQSGYSDQDDEGAGNGKGQQDTDDDDVILIKPEPMSPIVLTPSPSPPPRPSKKLRKKNKHPKSGDDMEEGELDSETEYETDTDAETEEEKREELSHTEPEGKNASENNNPDDTIACSDVVSAANNANILQNTINPENVTAVSNVSGRVDENYSREDCFIKSEISSSDIQPQESVGTEEGIKVIVVAPEGADEQSDPVRDCQISDAVYDAQMEIESEAPIVAATNEDLPDVASKSNALASAVVDEMMVMDIPDNTSDLILDLDIKQEKIESEILPAKVQENIVESLTTSQTEKGSRRKIMLHRSGKNQSKESSTMSNVELQETRRVQLSKTSGEPSSSTTRSMTIGSEVSSVDSEKKITGKARSRRVELHKSDVDKRGSSEVSTVTSTEDSEGECLLSNTQMEILELEMRARAIKAMIKAAEDEEEEVPPQMKRKSSQSSLTVKQIATDSKRTVQVPQSQAAQSASGDQQSTLHRHVEPPLKTQPQKEGLASQSGKERKLVLQRSHAQPDQNIDASSRTVQTRKAVAGNIQKTPGARSVSLTSRPRLETASDPQTDGGHRSVQLGSSGQASRPQQPHKVVQMKRRSVEDSRQTIKMKKVS